MCERIWQYGIALMKRKKGSFYLLYFALLSKAAVRAAHCTLVHTLMTMRAQHVNLSENDMI